MEVRVISGQKGSWGEGELYNRDSRVNPGGKG